MTAQTGRVFWITGLSGAGKSTLARALQARLPQSILLDGDELRAVLGATASSFDRQSRLELARTYARLCGLLAGQGHTVIMATISLFHYLCLAQLLVPVDVNIIYEQLAVRRHRGNNCRGNWAELYVCYIIWREVVYLQGLLVTLPP